MTTNEFRITKLHAKQNGPAVWKSSAIWEISRLRELVPEGKCENHPGSTGIAFMFHSDDGMVIVAGDPGKDDTIRITALIELPKREA